MNADSAFMIGTSHSICQDYAVAKNNYAILSDGCSMSPLTDIGARLIVKAAEQLHAKEMTSVGQLHREAAQLALQWTQILGLPPESADATLLSAQCSGEELVMGCSGDGAIVLRSWDSSLDVYSISFPSGYPFYPTYESQPERLDAWLANERAYKQVEHYRSTSFGEPFTLLGTSISTGTTEVLSLRASDYEFAVLLSDGVHSILDTRGSTKTIPMLLAIFDVVDFKGGYGAFVQRRANKLRRSFAVNGWRNVDDLAIAALYLGN